MNRLLGYQRAALERPFFAGAWGQGGATGFDDAPSPSAALLHAADHVGDHVRDHVGGLACLWAGDLIRAERRLIAAAAAAPGAADVWRDLAATAYLEGRGPAALARLNRAAALAGDDAQLWRLRGLAQYALGRFARAAADYAAATALAPDYGEAHRNLGRAWFLMGCFERSAASYRRATRLTPLHAEARRNLGNTLYVAGDAAAAAQAYRAAVIVDPADASNYYNYGFALADLERWPAAATAYRRAQRLRSNPLFLVGLRQAQEALGDPAAAETHAELARGTRGGYLKQAAARGESLDPAKVAHLRPLPSRQLLAGRGLPVAEAPTPDFAVRIADLAAVHPAARRSVAADQRWAAQGLALAGPGEVAMRHHPTWTNSAIVTPTHYARDTYYNIPIGCSHSRSFVHPLYKRDVDDLYDWLIDFNPLPEIEVDEPCVVLGGSGNFGHFVGDVISRLFVLEAFGVPADLPIYLHPLKPAFREIVDTLFPGRRLVDMNALAPDKALFRFRRALVPLEPPYALTCPAYRRRIAELGLFDPARGRGERIFITRRNEYPRHRIGNEAEIVDFLSRRGFSVVCPAELSLLDLIAVYGAARWIVSPQGAQNANILFASPDCRFIEILPANQSGYAGALGYASIYVYNVRRYDVLWGAVESMDLNLENDARPIFDLDALARMLDAAEG